MKKRKIQIFREMDDEWNNSNDNFSHRTNRRESCDIWQRCKIIIFQFFTLVERVMRWKSFKFYMVEETMVNWLLSDVEE